MRVLKRFRRGLSCEHVMEVLQAYLDGEVDDQTARKVSHHLTDCADCDNESTVYHSIKVSLAARRLPVDPTVMEALRRFGNDLVTDPAE